MASPEENRIMEVVKSNSDWSIVNSILFQENLIFLKYEDRENRKKFVDMLNKIYFYNSHKQDLKYANQLGIEVELRGITYNVCGLVHDNPFVKLKKEFRKEIMRIFYGKETICEDGFCDWIRGAKSFNEKKNLKLKSNFIQTLNSVFFYIINKVLYKYSELELMVSEIKTLDDYLNIKSILYRSYFPEPLGMNAHLYINNPYKDNCVIQNYINLTIPKYLERLIYEAKESVKYAEGKNINYLNIIVGCAHEKPLVYLLKNPDLLDNINIDIK